MKKLIIFLLITVMLLAACGSEGSPSSQREIDSIKDSIEINDPLPEAPASETPPIAINGPPPEAPAERTQGVVRGHQITFQDATRGDWFPEPFVPLADGARTANLLTGVRFGIYVAEDIDGNANPSAAVLEAFTDALYTEWFGDSAEHLLLVLIDDGNGGFSAMDIIGSEARVLFTDSAMSFLYDELEYYWELPETYSESEMFGLTLSNTAAWIVQQQPAVPAVPDSFSVFWGVTGNRVHISPECWSFGDEVLFGSLDKARSEGRQEWCGSCSAGWNDEKFLREGNPNVN